MVIWNVQSMSPTGHRRQFIVYSTLVQRNFMKLNYMETTLTEPVCAQWSIMGKVVSLQFPNWPTNAHIICIVTALLPKATAAFQKQNLGKKTIIQNIAEYKVASGM